MLLCTLISGNSLDTFLNVIFHSAWALTLYSCRCWDFLVAVFPPKDLMYNSLPPINLCQPHTGLLVHVPGDMLFCLLCTCCTSLHFSQWTLFAGPMTAVVVGNTVQHETVGSTCFKVNWLTFWKCSSKTCGYLLDCPLKTQMFPLRRKVEFLITKPWMLALPQQEQFQAVPPNWSKQEREKVLVMVSQAGRTLWNKDNWEWSGWLCSHISGHICTKNMWSRTQVLTHFPSLELVWAGECDAIWIPVMSS